MAKAPHFKFTSVKKIYGTGPRCSCQFINVINDFYEDESFA
jgi:hypothetical protein